MNIKQALKEKSRIVRKIDALYQIIINYNSLEAGTPRRYVIMEALDEVAELTEQLVALKTKIHRANMPVYDKIFQMSELKSAIKRLREMSVSEGKQVRAFTTTGENLEVEVDALKRDSIITTMQDEVDKLQDELDIHNAVTYL